MTRAARRHCQEEEQYIVYQNKGLSFQNSSFNVPNVVFPNICTPITRIQTWKTNTLGEDNFQAKKLCKTNSAEVVKNVNSLKNYVCRDLDLFSAYENIILLDSKLSNTEIQHFKSFVSFGFEIYHDIHPIVTLPIHWRLMLEAICLQLFILKLTSSKSASCFYFNFRFLLKI